MTLIALSGNVPPKIVATASPLAGVGSAAAPIVFRRDGVTVRAMAAGALLPRATDPVRTSALRPNARWAQDLVARDYAQLGVGFRPRVVVDSTSFVDDGESLVHLARFKFSPTLRKLTQSSMVDTTFAHLLRHESSHAFYNLTWRPALKPAFTAAFGDPDREYDVSTWRQITCGLRRSESPDFVSDYAQEHPLEDYAETMGVYLRLQGNPPAVEHYIQAKGNSPALRRKFDYVTALVKANQKQFQ
jgi:hypothetical protein